MIERTVILLNELSLTESRKEILNSLLAGGTQSSAKFSQFPISRFIPSQHSLTRQGEKLRLQKQKEVVEEKPAPIEAVEDPTPQKTEDSSYVWKPTGDLRTVLFLIDRSRIGARSHALVHAWH